MKVYIVKRTDDYGYDECTEQTIVAENADRALELAEKEYGVWEIKEKVDLDKEQILTQHFLWG